MPKNASKILNLKICLVFAQLADFCLIPPLGRHAMTTSSGENRTGGHKRQFEESFYECDDHLLSGNENGSLNFEELNNIITFHLECCKGPCNHDITN